MFLGVINVHLELVGGPPCSRVHLSQMLHGMDIFTQPIPRVHAAIFAISCRQIIHTWSICVLYESPLKIDIILLKNVFFVGSAG